MKAIYKKSYRSVYNLTAHLVFVTKYRKNILNEQLLTELEKVFSSILETRKGELIEFNGESDHVHLIVSYMPQISVSNLVANLKATSSKYMWNTHQDYLSKTYYKKRVFWTGSYFVASCGGITIETLRQYVEQYAKRYPLGQDRPCDP